MLFFEAMGRAVDLLVGWDPATISAILATLEVSTVALTASLVIGLPLGFALGFTMFPGRRYVRTLVDTLLALPTVFVGLVVYTLLSRSGPLGDWGLLFTLPGVEIGLTLLALPIVVALTATAIENMDERVRPALISLGASRRHVMLTSLWEARYAVLAAAVTAYGRVLTEVGIAMMVGGNIKYHTRTVTTAIALETGKGDFATGLALGMVLLLIALATNLLLSGLRKRSK